MSGEPDVHRLWAEALSAYRISHDLLKVAADNRYYRPARRAALLREAAWRLAAASMVTAADRSPAPILGTEFSMAEGRWAERLAAEAERTCREAT
jgi:hypothetical protein